NGTNGTEASPRKIRLEANIIAAEADGGRIAENIIYFARLLRAAGLPVGPEKTVRATEAVLAAGLESPHVLYWTLHAVFVNRRSEREIFNQAFVMFWKDPGYLQQMLSVMLPEVRPPEKEGDDKSLSRRMAESLFKSSDRPPPRKQEELDLLALETSSAEEVLREKDFEQMSAEEQRRARDAIRRLRLPFEEIRTRRFERARRGERIDLRAILRATATKGPDHLLPVYRRRIVRRPPIVVLCDISGSMDTYARVFLHFLYAITNDRDRVTAFLFGTRLTNITRALKNRDPDAAIAKVQGEVVDWSGGTRIGTCLAEFNKRWARRVLGQNALVLLFTDGLDREGGEGIDAAARRLRASCRRLVWLNPLMRYDRYEPLAAGAKALSHYASEMRPCHNLSSLVGLAEALEA
ncbi:MAG TPA: VWA domain-containing protein, partial [Hyphomicrobiaceae bacterium]|nr:VWA domain-containing protein [Hyphomicrobiaceae bacterium]